MKVFYSISELAGILNESIYDVANALQAADVRMTHSGKTANLSRWTGGGSRRGNTIFVMSGYYDDPDPSEVLILTDSLPESWVKKIQLNDAESDCLIAGEERKEAKKNEMDSHETPKHAMQKDSTETPADNSMVIANLFDPVKTSQLEAMFPDKGQWARYAERAKRNGLAAARDARSLFNPYLAAMWWLNRGPKDWKLERCLRVLANNLPARSIDSKHLLTGDYE